jgi:hypothetical protein
LIPSWKIPMNDDDATSLTEPMKTRARMLGMAQLLYHYGGMIVPPSFVCCKSLKPLFEQSTDKHSAFVVQMANHTTLEINKYRLKYIPSGLEFLGVKDKFHETIHQLVDVLKTHLHDQHFHVAKEFEGFVPQFCYSLIERQQLKLIDGRYVGVKGPSKPSSTNTSKHPDAEEGRMITIEDLFSDAPFPWDVHHAFGVWIPQDELLRRCKYQWFLTMTGEEIFQSASKFAIAGILSRSLMDGDNDNDNDDNHE